MLESNEISSEETFNKILQLFNNDLVLIVLHNIELNNGHMNHVFFNRQSMLVQLSFMELVCIVDKTLRDMDKVNYLYHNFSKFHDAYNEYINDYGIREPTRFIYFLFKL